jgi:hypothetical protein
MKNNKGMSTIVVTVIMIALVLAAIGVVWAIVNNVLEEETMSIGLEGDCLKINLVATKMICEGETCDVTLNRKAGGEDIGGVKLIFSNSTGNTGTTVEDVAGNIPELGTKITGDKSHGLTNELPDTVEVVVYFLSESGTEEICSQTRKFKF